MAYREENRYNRWGGAPSSSSGGGRYDPRDPYGTRGHHDSYGSGGGYDSRDSYGTRAHHNSYDSYGGGGYDSRDPYYSSSGGSRGREVTEDDYGQRIQAARRRMEQSSANSLRSLNECLDMGIDTAEELERQAETLDRVECRLDEMDLNLEKSKKNMRVIKSPFGGIANYFSRRKPVSEITDPKVPSSRSQSRSATKTVAKTQPSLQQKQYPSTGSDVVDANLDEMDKALTQLRGIGELINEQLDDSDAQIDRVRVKMERENIKIGKLNQDIKRELR